MKDLKRAVELNQLKIVEGERRVKVLDNDITGLRKKAETSEARASHLEETIESHGKKLEVLEESEGASGEREALNEDKVNFLERELKETTVRAEASERNCAVIKNTIAETEAEIASWTKKITDMEQQMVEMDNLADDPNYDLSTKYGSKSPTTASALDKASSLWGGKKPVDDDVASAASSRSSSRAGRAIEKPPISPEPKKEEVNDDEEENVEDDEEDGGKDDLAPEPQIAPPATKAPESEEESEEESDEESEEESDEEDGGDWPKWNK